MIKKPTLVAFALLSALTTSSAIAKISAEQAARLGNDLTPLGAIKAGNADGSIPAWQGGITKTPDNYTIGDHHPDPFAGDKVLFTINKSNIDQYKEMLSPGQVAMFDAYPDTFRMDIYQTRRSASYPQLFTMPRKNMQQRQS
jgi:hypothetical protein